jgi:hypothetical protein
MTNKNCLLRCKVPTIWVRARSRMRTTVPVVSVARAPRATSRRTSTRSPFNGRAGGAFGDDDFPQPESSGSRKPLPWRLTRMRPGTRSASRD